MLPNNDTIIDSIKTKYRNQIDKIHDNAHDVKIIVTEEDGPNGWRISSQAVYTEEKS